MTEELTKKEIADMFQADFILFHPEVDGQEDLLKKMCRMAEVSGYAKPGFFQAVMERENQFPTGIQTQFLELALPHTESGFVLRPLVIVAKLKEPIAFRSMGLAEGEVQASYVFLLLLKKSGAQVDLLQNLMNLCMDGKMVEKLMAAISSEQIYRLLSDFFE